MWGVLLCLCVLSVAWDPRAVFVTEEVNPAKLREEVVEMTRHAFESFRNYAGWERDELKPLTCTGHSLMGGLSTTLIDSLDMLAVLGDARGFTEGVDWVLQNVKSFDKDANVSVFETNIRVLGGLLSAHMIAANKSLGIYQGPYDGGLLLLAADLADRLLWAFETPTRLPFGTVNLRHGVPKGETRIVCAACCATFSLEFGMLSILTGNPKYEMVAKEAAEKLFSKRNKLGLLATHLEVDNGNWVLQTTAGLGGDTDSAYEYFYKAANAFEDERYMEMFNQSFSAVNQALRVAGDDYLYFVDADFVTNVKILNVRSLSAFWPGILAQLGHLEDANRTIHSFGQIVQLFGYLPESVCVTSLPPGPKAVSDLSVQPFVRGQAIDGHPLRPELLESVYHLYAVTRDPSLLQIALRAQQALRKTRVPCGFCSVHGVFQLHHVLLDQMDSFLISETLKYLYLIWDLATDSPEKNWVNRGGYIFTTEAHMFPLWAMRNKTPSKVLEREL